MRIFDNPNHPQYGPVRRAWVVLVQLDMLTAAERWSDHREGCGLKRWDAALAERLSEVGPEAKESHYQRAMIGTLLEGWL